MISYCEHKLGVNESQTLFKNVKSCDVQEPHNSIPPESMQNPSSQQPNIDDDNLVDEQNEQLSAIAEDEQEFSSKLQSMDKKQDQIGNDSIISSTQNIVTEILGPYFENRQLEIKNQVEREQHFPVQNCD